MKNIHRMKKNSINIFRHFATALMLLGVTLGLTGCFESEPPMITLSKSMVRIDQQAQSVTVTVTSNSEWTVKSDSDWCIPSALKGRGTSDIDFVVSRCGESSDRQAVITFTTTGGGNPVQTTLTISQSALNCLLQISPDSITVGNEPVSVTFAIASNTSWELSPTAEWITPSVRSGEGNALVKLAIAENTSHSEDRTAQVEVVVGTDKNRVVESLTVNQSSRALPTIVLSHNALMFSALAKSEGTNRRTIDVVTNITGEITVSSQFSWCNASYADGKVTISVDDNNNNESRNAIVNVIGDVNGTAVVKQMVISQAGVGSPLVTLVKDQVFVNANDGTGNTNAKIPVAVGFYPMNNSIKVSVVNDAPAWISDIVISNNLLTFNVEVNQLPKERTATVTLKAEIGSEVLFYPISIVQMAEQEINLIASSNYSNLRSEADTTVIALFSRVGNAQFLAYTADGEWCKSEIKQMTNGKDANAFLVISAEPNTEASARNANVVVVAMSADQRAYANVAVSQNGIGGPEISLIENSITLPVDAIDKSDLYKINVDGIDNTTTVKLESSQKWVKAVLNSDKDAILFTTETNQSSYARSAVITMVATKGGEQQILSIGVTQLGKGSAEVMFESLEYHFAAYGAKDYYIPAEPKNGTDYSVLNSEEWIDAKIIDGGLSLSVSYNYSSEGRTGSVIMFATNGSDSRYYTLTVNQDGLGDPDLRAIIPNITVENTEFGFSPVRNRVRIIADGDPFTTLETTQEVTWLDSRISNDKRFVELKATRNDNVESRTAVVTIIGNRGGSIKTASFNVTQVGTGDPGLLFPMDEYFFSADGVSAYAGYNGYIGTPITFTVLNGSTWHSFGVPMIEAKPDWVESVVVDTYYSDTKQGRVWVNVKPNYNVEERSGELTFRVMRGGVTIFQSIVLTQAGLGGPALVPARTNITLERYESTKNTPNRVTLLVSGLKDKNLLVSDSYTNANWFKVEHLNNRNDSLVFVATKANTSVESRTEAFYLKVMKGGQEQVITIDVTQMGTGSPSLTFANDVYFYNADGTSTVGSKYPFNSNDIHFTAVNNASFEVTSKPSWVHVEKGAKFFGISISVDSNPKAESRQGEIVFRVYNEGKDETIFQSITVVQNGIGGPNLVAARTDVTLGQNENTVETPNVITIPVTGLNDKDLHTEASYDNFDWFEANVDQANDKISFKALKANNSTESRTGYYHLKVIKGGQEQTLTFAVTQLGTGEPGLLFGSDNYFFTADGISPYSGKQDTVTIIYTALNKSVAEIVETPEWLGSKYENGKFKIWAKSKNSDAASRSGVVVFKVDNSSDPDNSIYQTVSVTQLGVGGPALVAARTEIDLNQNGDIVKIPVSGLNDANLSTDDSYTNANWLTVNIKPKNEFVNFKAEKNTSKDSRTAYYHLKVIKGGIEQVISFKVTQSGTGAPGIVFPVSEFTIPASGTDDSPLYIGYHLLNMSSLSAVTIFNAPDWLNLDGETFYNPTNKAGYIKVSALSNKTNDDRTGIVTFRIANSAEGADSYIYQSVSVTQLGLDAPNVVPALTDIVLDAEADDAVVVSASGLNDANLTIEKPVTNVDWLKVDVLKDENRIKFTAKSDNNSAAVRSTDVTCVVTKGSKSQILTFSVSQLAVGSPSIAFAQSEYVFNADGSSSYASYNKETKQTEISFTVENSADWEIVEQPKWAQITKSGDAILVKVDKNVNEAKRSGRVTFRINSPAGDEAIFESIVLTQFGYNAPNIVPATLEVTLGKEINSQYTLSAVNLNAEELTVKGSASVAWFSGNIKKKSNQIVFTAQSANDNAEPRTGSYKLIAERGGQEQVINITVKQLGTGSPSLLFANDTYRYSPLGGEKTINFVVENNAHWKIDSAPSWIKVDPVFVTGDNTDEVLELEVEENTASTERQGEIVFRVYNTGKDVEIFQKVNVIQAGVGGLYVEPAFTDVVLKQKKHTADKSNCVVVPTLGLSDVTVKSIVSNVSWLPITNDESTTAVYVDKEEGVINFTARADNEKSESRNATVYITIARGSEEQTYSFNVAQLGAGDPEVTFATTDLKFGSDAVEVNLPYTVSNNSEVTVASKPAFVLVEKNGSLFELKLFENKTSESRIGVITFRVVSGDKEIYQTVAVTQAGIGGPDVNLAYYEVTISNESVSTVKIPYTGNADPIVDAAHASWFAANVVDGCIEVAPVDNQFNKSTSSRQASLVLKAIKGTTVQMITVTVNQPGASAPSLEISNTNMRFNSEAKTLRAYVLLQNATSVSVTPSESWIKASLSDNKILKVTVDENATANPRFGKVALLASNSSDEKTLYTVNVFQRGAGSAGVTASFEEIEVPSAGVADSDFGILLTDIEGELSVASSASWVVPEIADDMVKFTEIAANNTGMTREAYLTVTATNSVNTQTAVIKVVQLSMDAPQIVVATNVVKFEWDDMNVPSYVPVSVFNADFSDLTVSDTADWLSSDATTVNGNTIILYPESKNTGDEERTAIVTLKITNGSLQAVQRIYVIQKADN